MSKNYLIAEKYSEALAEAELNESFIEELHQLKNLIETNKNLEESLNNPAIDSSKKKTIISEILAAKFNNKIINLVKLLIDKRRIEILPLLYDAYQKIYYQKTNKSLATINSSKELSEAELNNIKEQLEKVFKKDIQINQRLDQELIAGVKINIDNKVLDYSLKNKIKKIKRSLGA